MIISHSGYEASESEEEDNNTQEDDVMSLLPDADDKSSIASDDEDSNEEESNDFHWIHAVLLDLAQPELIPAYTVFSAMQRSLQKWFLASGVVTEKWFSMDNGN